MRDKIEGSVHKGSHTCYLCSNDLRWYIVFGNISQEDVEPDLIRASCIVTNRRKDWDNNVMLEIEVYPKCPYCGVTNKIEIKYQVTHRDFSFSNPFVILDYRKESVTEYQYKHHVTVKIKDKFVDPKNLVEEVSSKCGYPKEGYDMFEVNVKSLENGKYIFEWKSFKSCD